jgi:hypothetical protein
VGEPSAVEGVATAVAQLADRVDALTPNIMALVKAIDAFATAYSEKGSFGDATSACSCDR